MSVVGPPNEPASWYARLWVATKEALIRHIALAIVSGIIFVAGVAATATWAALMYWVKVGIPPEVVVSSLLEYRDLPGDWRPFVAGRGRFIIGAGSHNNPDVTRTYDAFVKEGETLSRGMHPSTRGKESRILNKEQMPEHQHEVYQHAGFQDPSPTSRTEDRQGAKSPTAGDKETFIHPKITGPAGGNEAVDMIPPYIALYYCQKS